VSDTKINGGAHAGALAHFTFINNDDHRPPVFDKAIAVFLPDELDPARVEFARIKSE
jgi:hypothetical protein